MKKILILIILSSFILGCRTKQKIVSYTKEGRTEIERIKFDSVKEINAKESTKKVTDNSSNQKKEEFSGDIIIRGKSDTLNPLVFHNILGNDTLQSILIRGNSDYYISNHYNKSKEEKKDATTEEKLNIIQQTAREIVSKSTIKELALKVEQETKNIKSSGFQFGAWVIIAILGIGAIVILGIYKYLK